MALSNKLNVSAKDKPVMKHVGVTAPSWKLRYGNHKASFKHSAKRKATKPAGYVWSLKDEGLEPEIKWRILSHNSLSRPTPTLVASA